jgi:hypothetical protein
MHAANNKSRSGPTRIGAWRLFNALIGCGKCVWRRSMQQATKPPRERRFNEIRIQAVTRVAHTEGSVCADQVRSQTLAAMATGRSEAAKRA